MTVDGESSAFTETTARGMVAHLRPSWKVTTVEVIPEGVNSTAVLTVEHETGNQPVVLKAVTIADDLIKNRTRAEPRLLSLLDQETALPVPTVYRRNRASASGSFGNRRFP